MGNWEWTPNVCVGAVRFEGPTPLELELDGFRLCEMKRDGEQLWTYYSNGDDEVDVAALDGRVASITCYRTFLFHGRNLIGASESEIRMQFRDEVISPGEFPFGFSLEIDALGLDLDFMEGRVCSVSVVGPS